MTSNGYLIFGDVEPGRVEVTVSDPGCHPFHFEVYGWADSKPNTLAGQAVANSMAQMVIVCN